ncbi:hypothetical protein ACLMAL_14865 [Nocardia sp. CWNU-33]|uniref:hypothetical protein n=1 Tax=Nocardia sp. CWNU-33 TaxID=3392117 RepID=UPI00398E8FC4
MRSNTTRPSRITDRRRALILDEFGRGVRRTGRADDNGQSDRHRPALVRAVDEPAATTDAARWQEFGALALPEASASVDALVMQYTAQYDGRIAPELDDTAFTYTITGLTRTGPDRRASSRTRHALMCRQIPAVFKDIDYTGTKARRAAGPGNYVALRPTSWSTDGG